MPLLITISSDELLFIVGSCAATGSEPVQAGAAGQAHNAGGQDIVCRLYSFCMQYIVWLSAVSLFVPSAVRFLVLYAV